MGFASMVAADMRYAIGAEDGAFRATLVWRGQTVQGNCTGDRQSLSVEDEGEFSEVDLQWAGMVADFEGGVTPPMQDTVTVNGVKFYVMDPQRDQMGLGIVLNLKRS